MVDTHLAIVSTTARVRFSLAMLRGLRHMGEMRTASTKPDKLAEPRFSYAGVEAGLMVALDIKDEWRTLFRSRIKHFQRIGANGPGVRPGKGSPLRYSFEQAARLALASLDRRHWD